MSSKPKILAFAGSAREDSYNKKLIRFAAEQGRELGADVTVVDLRDYPMPLYDGDLEQAEGLPEAAVKLKKIMIEADGLLLSCPEYNSGMTPLLKNTLDWVSRQENDSEPRLHAYQGKVAGLLAASPGGLGGLRGLVQVRSILSNIGVLVLPQQVAVPAAHQAFDDQGNLKDTQRASDVRGVVEALVAVAGKLRI